MQICKQAKGISFAHSRASSAASVRVSSAPRISTVSRAIEAPIDFTEYSDDADFSSAGAMVSSPISPENVKLRVRMRGYSITQLKEAVDQIRAVADATGVDFSGPVMLPTRRKLYCVLRSPHVDKDAREHFEVRTHHRLIDLKNLSSQAVEAMMQWVPPPGLECECSIVAA
jgi:small subunit ribosomal protein S10